MKILLIVFENAIDIAMHALDERNVEIAAVVTAMTPQMEERLQHYGLAERAMPYEQLDAALGEIDYNFIVFSEFGGGTEVADDLRDLRGPAGQQVNLTHAFHFTFSLMAMLMAWYSKGKPSCPRRISTAIRRRPS
ncbi:hypothetical protein [uncultured Selenomonas sp.]|uniref:hypothetical protein n=1 Tax=uncultured Selenomonas sp. TaxID=159275 RepID=UPI0025EBDB2B|nr:hypothetical protein [uncultured Selenomonas sp.]